MFKNENENCINVVGRLSCPYLNHKASGLQALALTLLSLCLGGKNLVATDHNVYLNMLLQFFFFHVCELLGKRLLKLRLMVIKKANVCRWDIFLYYSGVVTAVCTLIHHSYSWHSWHVKHGARLTIKPLPSLPLPSNPCLKKNQITGPMDLSPLLLPCFQAATANHWY